jgi:hypothetical protein
VHEDLCVGGILHRDVSINNVMLSPPASEGGRRQGFLIDFDYAFVFRQLLGLDDVDGAGNEDSKEQDSEHQGIEDEGVDEGVDEGADEGIDVGADEGADEGVDGGTDESVDESGDDGGESGDENLDEEILLHRTVSFLVH